MKANLRVQKIDEPVPSISVKSGRLTFNNMYAPNEAKKLQRNGGINDGNIPWQNDTSAKVKEYACQSPRRDKRVIKTLLVTSTCRHRNR